MAAGRSDPPVPGPVVRPFDPPDKPWLPGHRGVDIAAPVGTPVRSVTPGVVVVAGVVVDRPVVVVLMADGRRVTHQPVDPAVEVGDVVHPGQVLGHLAGGGDCATSCLHWGLKRGTTYENPLSLLGFVPVRLLPAGSRPAPPPDPGPQEVTDPRGLPSASGRTSTMLRPTSGPVSSPFGMRVHPVTGVRKLHDGVDLASPCGTPVRAGYSGRVVWSGYNRAWGHRVVVDHGRVGGVHVRTTYNHLASSGPPVGTVVLRGQSLGQVGSTGYSTGCHLHLGLERDGTLIDPVPYLGR
ncbi:M23 family metallopeptidase [Acidipropionibacterium timonense]